MSVHLTIRIINVVHILLTAKMKRSISSLAEALEVLTHRNFVFSANYLRAIVEKIHTRRMLYLVQRGKVRSQVIPIPEGLPEVLADITREVLRCQPTSECLCQFIIDYLHAVMVTREKAQTAKSIIDTALQAVDEIAADMCICDIPKEKSEEMIATMEDCFKRFLAKRRCEMGREGEVVKFNEVDLLDELIKKCKFSEIELKISQPLIEAAYAKFAHAYATAHKDAEGTEALYQYFRERDEKRRRENRRSVAAIKIQAFYRGYSLRKSLFEERPSKPFEEERESDFVLQDVAARKIQHFFRHRLSSKRMTVSFDPVKPAAEEDVCEVESVVSMTAHLTVQNKPGDKEEATDADPADETTGGGDAA
ncbi:uncharacterized protein ACN2A1_012030 isoform 1-T1 [Glossina fuscipes fuscipes]